MKKPTQALSFLNELLTEISKKDKLHSKKIIANINYANQYFPEEFLELLSLVYGYYNDCNLSADKISDDYLRMINDYRIDGLYFYKNGKYRCENQQQAFQNVYSNSDIMSYYMNALLISQILWKHHFNIYMYFQNHLKSLSGKGSKIKILEVGPGHGFFAYLVKKIFVEYEKLDLVDISETSLIMTKKIVGYDNNKIHYYHKDIFLFNESEKYDFIILGEILEHLDNPKEILLKLNKLLNSNGLFWITTPTNSPAVDHVYLFKNRKEIISLVESADLEIIESHSFIAEDVDEETANKKRITNLVGLFCKKNQQ